MDGIDLQKHIKVGKKCRKAQFTTNEDLKELSTDELYDYLHALRKEQYKREFKKRKCSYVDEELQIMMIRIHSSLYDTQISRFVNELTSRGINEDIKEYYDKYRVGLSHQETEQLSKAQQRIKDMKSLLEDTVKNNPDYTEKLRKYSDKLKVITEMKLEQSEEDRLTDVYGYIIQNISTEAVDIDGEEVKSQKIHLEPSEVIFLDIVSFVKISAMPEISFRYINGYVKQSIPLEETIEIEAEHGGKPVLELYHFVPDGGDSLFIEDSEILTVYI